MSDEALSVGDEMAVRFKEHFAALTDIEREAFVDWLREGYCRHCYTPTPPGRFCTCWNDD